MVPGAYLGHINRPLDRVEVILQKQHPARGIFFFFFWLLYLCLPLVPVALPRTTTHGAFRLYVHRIIH